MVPLAGIEPALLAELDFESSASTSSATGAFGRGPEGRCGEAGGNIAGGLRGSTRADVIVGRLDRRAAEG
jgi:hypothetical protein